MASAGSFRTGRSYPGTRPGRTVKMIPGVLETSSASTANARTASSPRSPRKTRGSGCKSMARTTTLGRMAQTMTLRTNGVLEVAYMWKPRINQFYTVPSCIPEPNNFDTEKCTSLSHNDGGVWSTNNCEETKDYTCRFKSSKYFKNISLRKKCVKLRVSLHHSSLRLLSQRMAEVQRQLLPAHDGCPGDELSGRGGQLSGEKLAPRVHREQRGDGLPPVDGGQLQQVWRLLDRGPRERPLLLLFRRPQVLGRGQRILRRVGLESG